MAIPKKSKAKDAESMVIANLMRAREALHGGLAQLFSRWDLTPQQYNVLRVLYETQSENGIPSQKIITNLVTRVPDMTRLLDRLQRAKLVERVRSESDRRVVRARLTTRGADLVSEIADPLARHHRTCLDHLTGAELVTLNRLLIKLCSSLPELAENDDGAE